MYATMINSLDQTADKSNGGKAGKTFAEAYQYFSALAPYTGNQKVKTDYTGNTYGHGGLQCRLCPARQRARCQAGSPYISPIPDGSCAPNYIIYISNGAAQDNTADNTRRPRAWRPPPRRKASPARPRPITLTPSGSASNVADEWARFMGKSSKNIVTYTVDVDKITTARARAGRAC